MLKLLSTTLASAVIAPLFVWVADQKLTNCAGNATYATDRLRGGRYNLLSLKPMNEAVAVGDAIPSVQATTGKEIHASLRSNSTFSWPE